MPRKYHMSWEGPPKYRWVKMYKGVRYRISCQELGAMVWTKEVSGAAANRWWENKLKELDGPSPVARVMAAVDAIPIEQLREMNERGEIVRKILAELPFVKAELEPEEIAGVVGPVSPEDAADRLGEAVGRLSGNETATPDETTLRHYGERFLALRYGKGRVSSYREVREFIASLYTATAAGLSGCMPIADIDEAKVEKVYRWLNESSLKTPTKKKRWDFFRRFVRYCWEAGGLALPRNLDSTEMRFKVVTQAVRTWDQRTVKEVVENLPSQLRLFALLGLNCGMTNVDIGLLRKDQVDLARGRLVRKRVKTAEHDEVPTVDYPLWLETLALLHKHWAPEGDVVLCSIRGTPLYSSRFEGGQIRRKDLIVKAWKKEKPAIPLKAFRSISATLIEAHESYGRYKGHFLGHSPRGVADRHYAAPSGKLFDRIVLWLREQVLGA
jgi:integrase